jgi:hypothetical protein
MSPVAWIELGLLIVVLVLWRMDVFVWNRERERLLDRIQAGTIERLDAHAERMIQVRQISQAPQQAIQEVMREVIQDTPYVDMTAISGAESGLMS